MPDTSSRPAWLLGAFLAALVSSCSAQGGGGGGGVPAAGASASPAAPVALPAGFFENGASAITVSGSGSPILSAFTFQITPDGRVLLPATSGTSPAPVSLPPGLTIKLLNDLIAARPLSSVPAADCASNPWGSYAITIGLGGAPSSNLLCASDPKGLKLQMDVLEIMSAANFHPTANGGGSQPAPSQSPGGK